MFLALKLNWGIKMNQPLKNKTLNFEQDYIETEIKWNLKLGDEIFKKSDIKSAVGWLKEELKKSKTELSVKDISKLVDLAFSDVVRKK